MAAYPFERLFRIFATLTPALATGCGEGIDTAQFSENLCDGSLQALPSVRSVQPVDYLELRRMYDYGYDPTGELVDAVGTLCLGSDDPAGCQTAFAALSRESAFEIGGFVGTHLSLAYTRGNEVGQIHNRQELFAFLGPIDSVGDAALLAVLEGHDLVCTSEDDAAASGSDFILHTASGHGCGADQDIEEHVVRVTSSGGIEVVDTALIERGDPHCQVGRRPVGLCSRSVQPRSTSAMGRFLAELAHLEAAAVPAFGRMAGELALHGAPRPMLAHALRSRADEIRHARTMARHARRYGGRPVLPRVRPEPSRTFVDVVADNAAEGCVRETYGALVAYGQACHARDPQLRRTFQTIAVEETRHAALSWAVDGWARARLRPAERRYVDKQVRDAAEQLRGTLHDSEPAEVRALAGLPDPARAPNLFDRLQATMRA